jgi:hypothetical protein
MIFVDGKRRRQRNRWIRFLQCQKLFRTSLRSLEISMGFEHGQYPMVDGIRKWWMTICIVTVIPATAVFHHLVFFRPSCMLNLFGRDYYPSVIILWLSHDPSLPLAIAAMTLIYFVGRKAALVRIAIAPIFLSFLPLSIWIWDIPFTNRVVCRTFHDGHVMLGNGIHLTTRHFYLLGVLVYLGLVSFLLIRKRRPVSAHPDQPSTVVASNYS